MLVSGCIALGKKSTGQSKFQEKRQYRIGEKQIILFLLTRFVCLTFLPVSIITLMLGKIMEQI
jgi:hypothetical protein